MEFSLEIFLNDCLDRLKRLKCDGKITVFTISSTSTKKTKNLVPYFTPIRESLEFNVTGCVIYSQFQAAAIAKSIDGYVDYIFVDSEKKVPLSIVEDKISQSYLYDFQKEYFSNVEYGDLSRFCSYVISKSNFREFKPNDITVDSVFSFVSIYTKLLSGKRVSILGAGNIGSKLALKFVEAGCNVNIYRRNIYKADIVANGLNNIKSESTFSRVSVMDTLSNAIFMSDIVIGTTDFGIIDVEHISFCAKNAIFIDTGKGSFTSEAIEFINNSGNKIYRTDVSAFLEGYIYSVIKQDFIINNIIGKNIINGITFVSGGILGRYLDVIVDNCFAPTKIIGLADGRGDILRVLSIEEEEILKNAYKVVS